MERSWKNCISYKNSSNVLLFHQRDNKDDEVTPKEIEKDEVVKTEEQGDGAKTKES